MKIVKYYFKKKTMNKAENIWLIITAILALSSFYSHHKMSQSYEETIKIQQHLIILQRIQLNKQHE